MDPDEADREPERPTDPGRRSGMEYNGRAAATTLGDSSTSVGDAFRCGKRSEFDRGFAETFDDLCIDIVEALERQVATVFSTTLEQSVGVIQRSTLRERQLHVSLVGEHAAKLALFLVGLQGVERPTVFGHLRRLWHRGHQQ